MVEALDALDPNDSEVPYAPEGDTSINVGDKDRPETSQSSKWIKGALINAGSLSKVYLGMDAATGLLMAVKQVELPLRGSISNSERRKAMLRTLECETELLKNLKHENIVQYFYSSLDDNYMNMFFEYVPAGSVSALLRSYGAFEEPLMRSFVRQTLEGLGYLHVRNIVHRNIKGTNILVDNKGGIKISDFSIAKKDGDNILTLQGAVFWMAPEVATQRICSPKADIWSVGCLVIEMVTGEHPWPTLTQTQALFKLGFSATPPIPSHISSTACDFLQRAFEIDCEQRPPAAELLQHPWMFNPP